MQNKASYTQKQIEEKRSSSRRLMIVAGNGFYIENPAKAFEFRFYKAMAVPVIDCAFIGSLKNLLELHLRQLWEKKDQPRPRARKADFRDVLVSFFKN